MDFYISISIFCGFVSILFCFVLFFCFYFVFMFVFGLCGFSLDLSIWVYIYLPIKAGTWEWQCGWFWFFFFFFWELYMRFRELGWFICVKELLDFFYVFRVQCWINWKCKLSVWWNDFVSYVWFIDWDDFDIFLHLQWLLGSQKYFVCLS